MTNRVAHVLPDSSTPTSTQWSRRTNKRAFAMLSTVATGLMLCTAPTSTAWAARPMITDDARIVDPKSCQVESWVRRETDRTELWALPGCNVGDVVELTAGGGRFNEAGGAHASDLLIQAKALLRPLKTNSWGATVSVGHVAHRTLGGAAAAKDYYINLPLSLSLLDDRVTLHSNTGWLREGSTGRDRATRGLAAETQLHPRVGLVTEAFGQVSRDSFYQLGLRFWVVPDRVQIDTTYGNRFGNSVNGSAQARWFSIGLRLLSPAFLP